MSENPLPPSPPTGDYVSQSPAPAGLPLNSRIGHYKLLGQIGEGGFGIVYVAEQMEPVRRKVALKVIKPGMDSREVLIRFEAERHALALMDHPNIARVFDAGTTETGRPYFVMELVKGVAITQFCDLNRLPPRERLELFINVCQAIQHAHQKGIIHRDIKPSNVLVSLQDGKPVAKVIDFGVAKALHQKLTDQSIYTGIAQMIGTPLYMSPEQAEMTSLDIDTRSDIYSLGVLLYELLTGVTPFDQQRFAQAAFDEIRRVIREEEPPKPSTRLSSSDSIASVSAQRCLEPAKLSKMVRGDLDWITMKCLEKDRARRYETANGLAMDIQRYLADEPVLAGPPDRAYRLRKFIRRNKTAVIAISMVGATLLLGIIGSTWGFLNADRARRAEMKQLAIAEANEKTANKQREIAESERQIAQSVKHFLLFDLLQQADPWKRSAPDRRDRLAEESADPTIKQLLDAAATGVAPDRIEEKFPNQPLVQAEILLTIGDTYRSLGEYQKAIAHLRRARQIRQTTLGPDHLATLTVINNLARAYQLAGDRPEAIRLYEIARSGFTAKLGLEHLETLMVTDNLAGVYHEAGDIPKALELREQVQKANFANLGADHPETLASLNNVAEGYRALGDLPKAIRQFEAIRDVYRKQVGSDHPDMLTLSNNLAVSYAQAGRMPEAITLMEEVLNGCVKKLGESHPDTLNTRHSVANMYRDVGRIADAIRLLEQVRDAQKMKPGPDHPDTLDTLTELARAYYLAGRLQDAIQLSEQVRLALTRQLGADNRATMAAEVQLAGLYLEANRAGEAETLLRPIMIARKANEPEAWTTFNTQSMLGDVLRRKKEYADAEPMLLDGYKEMKRRAQQMPPQIRKVRLKEAVVRLVALYEAWGKPEEAAQWKKELDALQAPAAKP